MTRLYCVRHDETTANAGGVTMEHAANPLSPLGAAQARVLAGLLDAEPSGVPRRPLRGLLRSWHCNLSRVFVSRQVLPSKLPAVTWITACLRVQHVVAEPRSITSRCERGRSCSVKPSLPGAEQERSEPSPPMRSSRLRL